MKKLILLLIIITSNIWGQEIDTMWIANYLGTDSLGSEPTKLLINQFNNIIITGVQTTSSGGDDIVILKYNQGGTLLWSSVYDGPAHKKDEPIELAIDSYGYIYVAGESRGIKGFSECNGIVILKYHPTGELAWVRRYDEEIGSIVYIQGLTVDSKRNIICTTKLVEGQTLTMNELITRKFYPTGDLVWEEHLPLHRWSQCYGINSNDFGSVFLGGWLWQGSGNPDYEFFALIKYDENGALQWFSSFKDSAASDAWCEVFTKDENYNFFAAGETEKISREEVFATIKYDRDGNFIWYREFLAGIYPEVSDISTDNYGNVLWIAEDENDSTYEYETIIAKYLANGDPAWVRYFPMDSDEIMLIRTDDEGNVYTLCRVWKGFYSSLIIKLDPLSKTLWTWSDDEEKFYPVDITIDNEKNVIVIGILEIEGINFLTTIKLNQSGTTSANTNSKDVIISAFKLEQNYPNPFNNTTVITYSIPKEGLVTLKVYNILGEEIASLINETKRIGNYEVAFNGDNLTSGVYLYKLTSGGFTKTNKMILLK